MRPVELGAGEQVLTAARPHPIVLAGPLAKAIGGLAVIVALFFGWTSAPAWFGLVLAAGSVVALSFVVAHVLTWRAGLVMVTSERVIHRFGLLHRVGREIPIHKIADVASRQGPLGQLLGYGELVVESIGASTARPIPAVRSPERVQHAIHQAERMALGRPDPAPSTPDHGSPGAAVRERDVPHSGDAGAGW
ncbi:MAG: PH domain-containing protein [Actinomycetota bacterium]|nr:PH domain-containing protein [Actinomycetota bacterium]